MEQILPSPLQLRAADTDGMMPITGSITLSIGDDAVDAMLTASLTPSPFEALLPIFHAITDALTERGIAREAAAGRTLSCRAGCGACCRQAVPLAPSEARALAALVEAMPAPRRTTVEARFDAARRRFADAGLTTDPAVIAAQGRADRDAYGRAYFNLGVACPFLDAESCSIHPDRPLACREYLVTSPASICSDPDDALIKGVPLAGRVSAAVRARDKAAEGHGMVVLVDALVWAAANPAPAPEQPGIEMALATIAQLPGPGVAAP